MSRSKTGGPKNQAEKKSQQAVASAYCSNLRKVQEVDPEEEGAIVEGVERKNNVKKAAVVHPQAFLMKTTLRMFFLDAK